MSLPPRITIRCAISDLGLDGWGDDGPIAGSVNDVSHPIIDHAVSVFPDDRDDAQAPETISTISPPCYKLKSSRWRGAAYRDADEQIWIVGVGQRKGKSRGDFYQDFMGRHRAKGAEVWLPTEQDRQLLQWDLALGTLSDWQNQIWSSFESLLAETRLSEVVKMEISDPFSPEPGNVVSSIEVELVKFDGELEPLGIELRSSVQDWSKREAFERLALYSVMCRIHKEEQLWSLSPGVNSRTLASIEFGDDVNLLGVIEGKYASAPEVGFSPGRNTHFVDRGQGVTDCTVNATPVTALCGRVFVPRQDFENRPGCEVCRALEKALKEAAEKGSPN